MKNYEKLRKMNINKVINNLPKCSCNISSYVDKDGDFRILIFITCIILVCTIFVSVVSYVNFVRKLRRYLRKSVLKIVLFVILFL